MVQLKKYYNETKNLIILKLNVKDFKKKLKWEVSRDNQLFPHLYGFIDYFYVERIEQNFFKDLMNYKLISKLSESISPEILHKIFLFFLKLRLYKNQKKIFKFANECFW